MEGHGQFSLERESGMRPVQGNQADVYYFDIEAGHVKGDRRNLKPSSCHERGKAEPER